jgi:hypothetical protein
MIAIFGDDDMGKQCRPWPAPLDRQGWHGCLHDRLTAAAAHLRPDMDHPLEGGWNIFQDLSLVVADLAEQRATTAGAGMSGFMNNDLTWQMIGQRFAAGLFTLPTAGRRLGLTV